MIAMAQEQAKSTAEALQRRIADAAAAVSGFVRSTVWNGSAAAFNGVASRDARFSPFAAQKPSPSPTALCKAASGGGVRGRSLLLVQPIAVASLLVEKQRGN